MICEPCYRACFGECKNKRCECAECGAPWPIPCDDAAETLHGMTSTSSAPQSEAGA